MATPNKSKKTKQHNANLGLETDPRTSVYHLLTSANALLRTDIVKCSAVCAQSVAESRAFKMKDLLAVSLTILAKCFVFQGDRTKAATSKGSRFEFKVFAGDD